MFKWISRWLFTQRRKSKKQLKTPNAIIVVERTRKRIFRYVPKRFIPSNSFEKEFEGNWLHILGLDLTGTFWPIERPLVVKMRMPTDLFMALHCTDEVNEVFGLPISWGEKIKLGVFVTLCVANLIAIFLIATASGGG